jgi:hypothetical protein
VGEVLKEPIATNLVPEKQSGSKAGRMLRKHGQRARRHQRAFGSRFDRRATPLGGDNQLHVYLCPNLRLTLLARVRPALCHDSFLSVRVPLSP